VDAGGSRTDSVSDEPCSLVRLGEEPPPTKVLHERCCGLDIHRTLIVTCSVVPGGLGQPRKQVRTFGTMSDTCSG
jgi:hypothetical protein